MARVNKQGYVETRKGRHKTGCIGRAATRNCWIVKSHTDGMEGSIKIGNDILIFPKCYVGKRVRIKIEVIEDKYCDVGAK